MTKFELGKKKKQFPEAEVFTFMVAEDHFLNGDGVLIAIRLKTRWCDLSKGPAIVKTEEIAMKVGAILARKFYKQVIQSRDNAVRAGEANIGKEDRYIGERWFKFAKENPEAAEEILNSALCAERK